MKLLGITGGVGMGKSTSGRILAEKNLPVIDTDKIARDLVEPGQPALDEIKKAFGRSIVSEAGTLRRPELARIVFQDANARERLENILHPRIRSAWQAEVTRWRTGGVPVGAVIIPLLFETDAGAFFDHTLCACCMTSTQMDRLKARGWTEGQIEQRIGAQFPIERKIALSTFVIWTETSIDCHSSQLEKVLQRIF